MVWEGVKLAQYAWFHALFLCPNATIKIKANKKTYQKVVKMIKASGVPETVKFKRIK